MSCVQDFTFLNRN